ncbi:hypothetical protein [Piscibacillus salipiscarius]|uniref:hypothetical protein n=1 Tax=Piscibacillus salipiscarius TaxID=299480 RepID=UPI000AF0B209
MVAKGEEELFTKDEFIDIFDPERLSTSPAVFDTGKLKWMNNQYIKSSSLERVIDLALPHLIEAEKVDENVSGEDRKWVEELIALYKDQLNYGAEIVELTELFFKEEIDYGVSEMEVLQQEHVPNMLSHFQIEVGQMEEFTPENIKAAIKATQKTTGVKGKKLFMPIRVAVTGQQHGPELPNAIHLLGQRTVMNRLNKIVGELNHS